MSLKRQVLKSKPLCKVTFKIPRKIGADYSEAQLLGDFNGWDPRQHPMKKLKDGSFTVTLDLPSDCDYQFRYLLDGRHWINEDEADRTVPSSFPDAVNSVICL